MFGMALSTSSFSLVSPLLVDERTEEDSTSMSLDLEGCSLSTAVEVVIIVAPELHGVGMDFTCWGRDSMAAERRSKPLGSEHCSSPEMTEDGFIRFLIGKPIFVVR